MNQKNPKARTRTLSWIYSNAKPVRLTLICLVAFNGVQGLMATFVALSAQYVADSAEAQNGQALVMGLLMLLLVIATQITLRAWNRIQLGSANTRMTRGLRQRMLGHLLSSDYGEMSKHVTGEIMSRITTDLDTTVNVSLNLPPTAALNLVQLCGVLIALLALKASFVLILLPIGLVAFFIYRILRRKLRRTFLASRAADGHARSFIQEMLMNLLMVKGANLAEKLTMKADGYATEYMNKSMRHVKATALSHLVMDVAYKSGYLITLAFCGFGLYNGTMDVGELTAILLLSTQIQAPFQALSSLLPNMTVLVAAAERLMALEDIPAEPPYEPIDWRGLYQQMDAIRLQDVCLAYGERDVLSGASLTLPKGLFYALTGASGAGKTTLFKLLLCVATPSVGAVLLGDQPVTPATRALFAYVPQSNNLIRGTVRENILLFAGEVPQQRIHEALEQSCALDFVNALDHGLDTELGEQGFGLSLGQVQRLAVARALLTEAPILLLDEATSALDRPTEKQLLENLRALPDRTVLCITHREAALAVSDMEIAFDQGKCQLLEQVHVREA